MLDNSEKSIYTSNKAKDFILELKLVSTACWSFCWVYIHNWVFVCGHFGAVEVACLSIIVFTVLTEQDEPEALLIVTDPYTLKKPNPSFT